MPGSGDSTTTASGRALDNTVFYITYAGQIGEKMGLSQGDRARLIVLSNQVMQLLDERDNPPYKTFEYIGKFADNLAAFRGDYFAPRLTRLQAQDVDILLLEPPCGSNTWVLRCQGALLAFDGGFCLYRDEAAQAAAAAFAPISTRLLEPWPSPTATWTTAA